MSALASNRSEVLPIVARGARHLTREMLRGRAGRLGEILRACPDPIGIFDRAGRLQTCNAQWRQTLDVTTGERLEQMMNWRLHAEDVRPWLAVWRAALRDAVSYVVEHRMAASRHEPYRWYLQYGIPLQDCGEDLTHWLVQFAIDDRHTAANGPLRVCWHEDAGATIGVMRLRTILESRASR